jgi:hypothetical protein
MSTGRWTGGVGANNVELACSSTAAALLGALGMRAIALAASARDMRCSTSLRLWPRSSQAQSRE